MINRLDIHTTNLLRGIAILLVVVQHVGGQRFSLTCFTPCGGIGVAMFLMLSGYGLHESYLKKGLKHYWKNKITKVAIPYFLWITFGRLLKHEPICCEDYILDVFLLKTSYWYINCLFFWYVMFYAVMALKNRYICLLIVSFLYLYLYSKDGLRAEQSFSFFIGVVLSKEKYRIAEMSCKKINVIVRCSLFFVLGILGLLVKHLSFWDGVWLKTMGIAILIKVSLSIAVILLFGFLLKRFVDNKLMEFLGVMSLELYLVHIYYLDIVKSVTDLIPFIGLSLSLSYGFFAFNKWYREEWLA